MQRHAILIANSLFPRSEGNLSKLTTVQDDFEGMKTILRDLRGRFQITPLPDMEGPEILGNLERALRDVAEGDLVLIYYAGHGRILRQPGVPDQFLLSTYRSGKEPDSEADLEFKAIESRLSARRIRRALIVLDCCHSGAVDGEVEARGGVDLVRQVPFDVSEFKPVDLQIDSADADDQASREGDGVFIITACTSNQIAMGSRSEGNGDFTRQFMDALVGARDESLEAITVTNIFARIEEAMKGSPQTPTLVRRRGTGDLVLARPSVYGERAKRTLLHWKPLPQRLTGSSSNMSPMYLLDSGFRFVHWNAVFEDVIARQLGLVLGAHATELIEGLDNKSKVNNRNPRFFPMPDEHALARAEETGEIWEGFPLTDVEQLEFRSDRFGLIVFNKLAYQLPAQQFARRKHWQVQLNVQFVQRPQEYWFNARAVIESQDLWNEYAESYDNVISSYPPFQVMIDSMTEQLQGHRYCLDVGAGTGNITLSLLKDANRHVTAIEYNDAMLQKLDAKIRGKRFGSRIRLLKGNARTVIERIVQEDAENPEIFDSCIMMNVLHVMDDAIDCLKAAYRVMKPNSLLVLSTPYAGTMCRVDELFQNIKTYLRQRSDSANTWPTLERQWESARRINRMLAEKAEFSPSQIRQMLKEAQFSIETPDLKHELDECVLIAIARKPDTRVKTPTPAREPADAERADKPAVDVPSVREDGKHPIQIFVSYSRDDKNIADEFLDRLKRRLKPSRAFRFRFWKDNVNVLVGQDWRSEIDSALQTCDVGLLLLSPGFLGSEFITDIELVQFDHLQKVIVPVMIHQVNPALDDLRGLDGNQIFSLETQERNGLAYTACDESQKGDFVERLYARMVQRLTAEI